MVPSAWSKLPSAAKTRCARSVKDAALTQHQHPFYGSPKNWQAWGYSIRTDQWRYTEWRAIAGGSVIARELYDHQSDPKETRNLAAVPDHGDTVDKLASRLAEFCAPQPRN